MVTKLVKFNRNMLYLRHEKNIATYFLSSKCEFQHETNI
jgi:hypothetical protein